MERIDYRRRCRMASLCSALVLGLLLGYRLLGGCSDHALDPSDPDAGPAWLDAGADRDRALVRPLADSGLPPDADAGTAVLSMLDEAEGTEYVLLLGFDRSSKLPGRTDAIMIVAAQHDTGDVGVISIPRDLWVDIPGAEPGRINKVYRVGNMLHGKGGGHRLIKQVIARELGISVDYTAAVDFGGFEKLIDLLGGIDVDVACPIKDNFIAPNSKTGYEKLSLAAGHHRMNGRTALLFSRSRHGRTDLDRARRQQAVLLGIKRRASSLDVIPRLPSLFAEFHKHVATDLDLAGAFRMVRIASAAGSGMVHGMVLRPPLVHSWRSPEGKAALRLNRTAFAAALDGLFDAPAPGARSRPVCPAPDRALNWRELARARKARKAAERAALLEPDAGIEAAEDGDLAL